MKPLKFVIPNGSLLQRLLTYLALAGYDLDKPDRRGFCGIAKRVEFWVRDRRMIPRHVAVVGKFDAGITGYDIILNSEITKGPHATECLRTVSSLCFSRSSNRPSKWVLAIDPEEDAKLHNIHRNRWIPVTVGCELSGLARHLDVDWSNPYCFTRIVQLEGNEEMAIQDGLCDAILVVTESGDTLREIGLKIVSEKPFLSMPQIIAKPQLSSENEDALQKIRLALEAVIGAASS